MKYSFIIPTFNRLHELKELLGSLEDLNKGLNFELVVVDDGSTDGTEIYFDGYNSQLPIRYFKQENKGPGAARNRGMQEANGEYFIFVDSDCLLPAHYLQEIKKGLIENKFDAFGGPDTYHPSFSPLLKAINYSMTSFIGTGGTRGSTKSVTKYFPRSFNMGIHRKVYETIGGFGNLRHGQDMDYSARIYEAGFKVGLIPEAFVYHKRRTSLWRFFKQIHNWGVTRINLASMHQGMLKPVHLLPLIIVVGTIVVCVLSIFIAPVRWMLVIGLILAFILAIIAFAQSYRMYRSIQISFMSIVTIFLQIGGYGLGTLNGIWQKWILRKEIAKGITKNYYK